MSDFKVGTTVRLNSGGPLMTIRHIADDDGGVMVVCDWVDKNDKPQTISYRKEQLQADDGSMAF